MSSAAENLIVLAAQGETSKERFSSSCLDLGWLVYPATTFFLIDCISDPGGYLVGGRVGVRPRSLNPDPVYDEEYKNFHTLFMISWEFPYPVYEIAVNFHTLFMCL